MSEKTQIMFITVQVVFISKKRDINVFLLRNYEKALRFRSKKLLLQEKERELCLSIKEEDINKGKM